VLDAGVIAGRALEPVPALGDHSQVIGVGRPWLVGILRRLEHPVGRLGQLGALEDELHVIGTTPPFPQAREGPDLPGGELRLVHGEPPANEVDGDFTANLGRLRKRCRGGGAPRLVGAHRRGDSEQGEDRDPHGGAADG